MRRTSAFDLAAGAYLFLDTDIDEMVSNILDCAQEAHSSYLNMVKIRKYVTGALDRYLPDDAGIFLASTLAKAVLSTCIITYDRELGILKAFLWFIGVKLTGKLEISVTAVPSWRNVRITKYDNKEAVKAAVLASACVLPPPVHL